MCNLAWGVQYYKDIMTRTNKNQQGENIMVGLKVKDSEGNIFTITAITVDNDTQYPNGVEMKGLDGQGSKSISSFDLLFFTVIQ